MSDIPPGKFLVTPLHGGVSLIGLLRAPSLERVKLSEAMGQISSILREAEGRKQASGYKTALSAMREMHVAEPSEEIQRQRLDDVSDFS